MKNKIKMEQAVDVHTLVHKCTTINMYVVHILNLTYTCIALQEHDVNYKN